MRKLIIALIIILLLVGSLTGCSSARKSRSELRGLMLLDNTQLGRNRAYYSKHNIKVKNEAYRRFKKNNRNL